MKPLTSMATLPQGFRGHSGRLGLGEGHTRRGQQARARAEKPEGRAPGCEGLHPGWGWGLSKEVMGADSSGQLGAGLLLQGGPGGGLG